MSAGKCGVLGFLFLVSMSMEGGRVISGQPFRTEGSSDKEKETKSERNEKKVYTNEDLIRLREKSKGGTSLQSIPDQTRQSKEQEKRKSEKPGSILSVYRDLDGHDRTYWRKKIAPLRSQLDSLNLQIDSLHQEQSEVESTQGIRVSRDGHLKTTSKNNSADLSRRTTDLENKKRLVLKSIQDLEEDARKAQALPEWLR